ncbi:MAG: DMT family protein [Bacteroidetes bacterium]|nr:DMT family protein [Bacteroidota bacterium]
MKTVYTLLLLSGSNIFMNLAWYGHLKFKDFGHFKHSGLWVIILVSWGLAFFEYCLQVPANRIGYQLNGGPFSLMELKILQEIITLVVFTVFALVFFKSETLKWNHVAAFICLVMAVYFVFYKKA